MTIKRWNAAPAERGRIHLAAVAIAVLSFTCPLPLFAVLGGSEASVLADQVHMQAALRSTHGTGYTVHELRAPTGIVVREYASGGTVFGVAWEGPWPPDIQQLLGSYFEPYQQALAAQNQNGVHGRRPVHVELPALVVNISGHPRSFHGQAYVPDMMPQGVKAEEIR